MNLGNKKVGKKSIEILFSQLSVCLLFILISGFFSNCFSQSIDHWETLVFSDDDWQYKIGAADIPEQWIETGFDASQWSTGTGGFGFGDDDDNTILNDVFSVFIRRDFEVLDENVISSLLLHADFDDGFVAYLNGIEIARRNLGMLGARVPFDESATDYIEPNQSEGLLPVAIAIDAALLGLGKNTLAIQVHNFGNNSTDLSSNFFLSAGISDMSMTYNPPPDWFGDSFFETNLPILKVSTNDSQAIQDEPRKKAHLGIIYNGPDAENFVFEDFNAYDGVIAIEIRGTSSQLFDKKGYGFETQNEDGSNNNVALLGMPEENDWILHGPYSDKSLLRNVLTYHLGNLSGRYAPRTRLCELFINDQYEGVYVLTEKIKQDKNRVDIAKLTEEENTGDDLTGGYIIKIDRNEGNVPGLGWYSTFPDEKFIAFVEPKDDDITAAQTEYIQRYMHDFESFMASSAFAEGFDDFVDVSSLVDYFLVTEIGKQIDAFKLSFYLHKDKDSKGGKLQFGPLWDFNFGYGNFDFNCSPDFDGWSYEFPDCGTWHPFWLRKLIDIPNVQNLSNCRWLEMRAGAFKTDSLLAFIDKQVSTMDGAISRNFERWPILGEYVWGNDFIGSDYRSELEFFKSWLVNRLNWMDDNMLGDCENYVSGTAENLDAQFNIYPNPAAEVLNVSFVTAKAVRVEIYGLHNQLLKSRRFFSNGNNEINITGLANGVYTVFVKSEQDGTTLFVERFVVVK